MNTSEHFAAVMKLDLSPIKQKLMHAASGEGWTAARADAVEQEYRRFLCLMKTYPDALITPLVDVDTFWHYHILDTMKYARDCDAVYGYFLHHYPYLGLHGEDDEKLRLEGGERMHALYEATFGEDFAGRAAALERLAVAAMPMPATPGAGLTWLATAQAPTSTASAFCAGPIPNMAYCAGPAPTGGSGIRRGPAAQAGTVPDMAYCAGPAPTGGSGIRLSPAAKAGAAQDMAYCAGPAPTGGSGIRRNPASQASPVRH